MIVCQVGSTQLKYDARAIDDLHACSRRTATGWTSARPTSRRTPSRARSRPGAATRRTRSVAGTALRKGYRGRFGMYMPPLMEALGLAELTHDAKGNKMRAK